MLANQSDANIIIVHVIGKQTNRNHEQLAMERQLAKTQCENILQTYKGAYKGNGLSYTIKEGSVFKEITQLAETSDDALIVLSTHGASGFEELFIGGNTYKITSHSKVPVITIRKGNLASQMDRIVLPLDITFETREKVPFTAELAKLFHAEVHLVSIHLSHLQSIESKLQQYVNSVASYLGGQGIYSGIIISKL